MPGKTRTRKYKKYAKRGKSLASKAYTAAKKALARTRGIERKKFDYASGPATVTSTASVTCMSDISEGLEVDDVIGRSLQPKNVMFRANISANGTPPFNYLRMIIFQDRNDVNNTAIAASELMDQPTNILSPISRALPPGRINVLHDKVYTVGTAASQVAISIKKWFRLKGNMTFAQSGSFDKNHLFLYVHSTDAANGPTLQVYNRLYYTDL